MPPRFVETRKTRTDARSVRTASKLPVDYSLSLARYCMLRVLERDLSHNHNNFALIRVLL